jgi:hypothetical protein
LRKCLLMLMAVFSSSLFASAAHAQTVQAFLGYSYLRPSITVQQTTSCTPGPTCAEAITTTVHPNLKGWDVSGTLNPTKIFGITGDVDSNYGSIRGSTVHTRSYLFGPQIHFPGRISPFGRVLIGKMDESVGSNGLAFVMSNSSFAFAAGGGIDIKLAPYVSVRAIQIDYLRTGFAYASSNQNQFRAAAGFVFHF